MDDHEIVLSYHDAIIRKSDYKLLNSNDWITDSLIEFWFEYLSNDLFEKYSKELLCLSPSLSQLIKLTDDLNEIKAILGPLEINSKDLILIPINDSTSCESISGTHWSLLVFIRKKRIFEYYDSASNSGNIFHCRKIAFILKPILHDIQNIDLNINFEPCHQQDNSYNCGIHLICNSEAVCRRYLLGDHRKIIDIVSKQIINRFREKMAQIIDSLR